MDRRSFLKYLAGAGLTLGAGGWYGLERWFSMPRAESGGSPGEACQRIVVLGDPHLPVRREKYTTPAAQDPVLQLKAKLPDDVNGWDDVALIAVLGDIAARYGIDSEYADAKAYFSRFQAPVCIMGGNHDYVYRDEPSPTGHLQKNDAAGRARKLAHFQTVMGLEQLYYTRRLGSYFLIFLTPDALGSYLTEISEKQLQWFADQLAQHRDLPTIVFFHAPLAGTLPTYQKNINTPDFIAQPEESIGWLLEANPQVRLWVSGHTHTPATNPGYADVAVNTYADNVVDIHNPTLDATTLWTNSLYLYRDRIAVRTFNHKTGEWVEKLDRVFSL